MAARRRLRDAAAMSRRIRSGGALLVLIVLALYAVGPLIMLSFNALKSNQQIAADPLGPPTRPVLDNLAEAWELGGFADALLNSAFLAGSTALGVCAIAFLTAYSLARLLSRPRGLLLYVFVGTAVPAQLFVIPIFFVLAGADLTNSLPALMVIYWALFTPFATLLLRAYLLTLPPELEDAARIDGGGEWTVMVRVILPLARPGLLVVALTTGLFAWNEFFFANTLIDDQSLKPVSTSLLAFRGSFSRDWGLTSAASLIMIGPVIILFLILHRRFIAGLTSGGLKG